MKITSEIDIPLTRFCHNNRIDWFAQFMNESLSNRDKQIGAGDIIWFLLIIPSILLYILSWLCCIFFQFNKKAQQQNDTDINRAPSTIKNHLVFIRPYLGFLLTSAFSTAFLFVHTTKQVVGRARPDTVFNEILPYSEWYEFGPHFITQGTFTGSFPSGHTATASIAIALAYIIFDINRTKKWYSYMLFCIALVFATGMGMARMMSASHWATDVTFTIFSCWAIIHSIFYWGLQVPYQVDFYCTQKKHRNSKQFFELRICLNLFFFCLGVWAFFTGLRAGDMGGTPLFNALMPIGLAVIFFFSAKVWILGFFKGEIITADTPELSALTTISGNVIEI